MKRIVIVGASSGIGRLAAIELASRGWTVGIAARNADRLAEVAATNPKQIIPRTIDVTAPDARARFRDLVTACGGIDSLLFTAGCGWYNPSLDVADDMHTDAVNVSGFTAIIATAFAIAAESGRPLHIAAVTSVAGVRGLGVSAAYSASKRYQWTYLQGIEQLAHLRRVPVTVGDIRPGFIRTALLGRGPARLPMVMDPEKATRAVVRAVVSRRRVTVIDTRWAILTALWRLVPRWLWRLLPVRFS